MTLSIPWSGERLIIGRAGHNGDYFLVALYKGMFWSFKYATNTWVPGQSATFQGQLINLSDKKIYSSTMLPLGKIDFFLAADTNQDGVPNFDRIGFDKAIVEILR